MIKKVLIVGLGQIGMQYDLYNTSDKFIYTHARAFSIHPNFKLIGGVDPDTNKRNLFSKNFNCATYPNISLAAKEQSPDLVIIALPTEFHLSAIEELLHIYKPKIILCEKPLAYNLNDAKKIVDICNSEKITLFVNYMRRVDPGVIEIKKHIDLNKISKPIKGTVWYSGGFFNNGSHFFNLLEYWLGSFISGKQLDKPRLLNNGDYEFDAEVEFDNGKVYFLCAWKNFFSYHALELISSSGRLRYDEGGKFITWQSIFDNPNFLNKTLEHSFKVIDNDIDRYQWHVADHLANFFFDKPCLLCTGNEALTTIQDMHKILLK